MKGGGIMGQKKQRSEAVKRATRSVRGMNIQIIAVLAGIMWCIPMLTATLVLMLFHKSEPGYYAAAAGASAVIAVIVLAVWFAVLSRKENPDKEYRRLFKEYGEGSDELYEFAQKQYEKFSAAGKSESMNAADWAVRLAGIYIDRGKVMEARYILDRADMKDFFDFSWLRANIPHIVDYFHVQIMTDIELCDIASEDFHYRAAEDYLRRVAPDSIMYPYVIMTRCDHLIFRGEAEAALGLLREALDRTDRDFDSNAVMELYFRLGKAYAVMGDVSRANEEFDRVLEICPEVSRNYFTWKINRVFDDTAKNSG